MKNILLANLYVLLFFIASAQVYAQDCAAIFPDAVSNSNNGASITLGNNSTIFNSPDNILDTRNLTVPTFNTASCNGAICTKSNTIVPSGAALATPNGPDVTLGFREVRALAPGNYGELNMGTESQLLLSPGDYTFRDASFMGFQSQILLNSDGTARLWFRRDFTLSSQATIGSANVDRRIFLHTDQSFSFGSSSTIYGVLFAERDVTLNNQAHIYGAVTAKQDIALNSASYVTYVPEAISTTDFSSFCVGSLPPAPVAEYQLEVLTWNGTAGEMLDSGPNGLHGAGYLWGSQHATTEDLIPALAGNPGSCRYTVFEGDSNGFLYVNDNALLDLPQLTFSAWIYPTSYPSSSRLRTIITKGTNSAVYLNSAGRIQWNWSTGGGNYQMQSGGSIVALNQWQHVVVAYDRGSQKIFIDGVERASAGLNSFLSTNGNPLFIGAHLSSPPDDFRGYIDEVNIFDRALPQTQVATLMATTHPCTVTPVLGSFQIDVGGGVASVCAAKEISITAFDTNGAVLADYSGTVSISTSTAHGDWSATDGGTPSGDPPTNALAPGANDSGAAGYTFAGVNDGGAIAVFLNNQHAEQLTITVSDATAGVSTTSSLLGFSENAFDIQNIDALAADIVGGRDHNFRIDMWRRDPSSGDCSVATNYNVGAIKMWVTRVLPDDPSGAAPSVRTGSGVFGLPNGSPASANVTFPFVAGTANFELLTTDVGKYRIDVSDDASGFSDQPILGATSTLIVRPFALDIQAAGNPAGVTATGPAFIPAGQNFNVTARAVLWSASDDGNDDGIADGHADGNPSTGAILSDNTVAASFGQESPTEGVQLSATLIAPLGGADPGLGNGDSPSDGRQIASFSSGVGTSGNVFFAEVGAIEINSLVLDGDYLAMGSARTQKIIGSSYVGRFYPASFALTAGSVTEACDTFSYMEQPFVADYQLTALNGRPAPTTTTNYAGAFAKLGGGSGTFNYGARGDAQDLSARLAGLVTTVSWSAGVGSVVLDPVTFTRQLSTAPDGPITDLALGVIPQDTDGVTLATASLDLDVDGDSVDDHGLLGGSIQRYGRMRAKDAFGPESASIPMFWQTEYYNGAQFVRAADDNCSQLAFSQINFVGATTSVNAGAQTVTVSQGGVDSVFDFSDPLGSQTCMTASEVGFCQGFAGVAYGATGVTGSYPVEVNLANYPHLRFDWDGDGNYGDTQLPRFTINFENYRGHDRIIFWRERL